MFYYTREFQRELEEFFPTRPPEGSGLADGRSDARRIGDNAESPSAAVSPAVASDQSSEADHDVLKLARAC